MNVKQLLQYLDSQKEAILHLIDQLDEIQVAFNAQFDDFKTQHDATLDRLGELVLETIRAGQEDTLDPALQSAVEKRRIEERTQIEERRQVVRQEYLPRRRQAADEILAKAQAELAELRALNPQLDQEEETLKQQRAELKARLEALNDEIRSKSRGLGLIVNFLAVTRADRERHRVLGKLEALNDSLYQVRIRWERERTKIEENQAALEKRWQLESIAVARLQSELDQLDDENFREDLALRRAIRHVLDELKTPAPGSDPELNQVLESMIQLNIRTDAYHDGLAAVGGLIGLLRGFKDGLEAIEKSIQGLKREQEMHSAYLSPLKFNLPPRIESMRALWPKLDSQFDDEKTIGQHPLDFAAQVEPLLQDQLSETNIKATFTGLGAMIERATAQW
jgi:hypothetical protein